MSAVLPPTPELALHLESWLAQWPMKARDLWHDLAQGRLAEMTYQSADGQCYSGGSWPSWCYLPNVLIESWMQVRQDLKQPFFQSLTDRYDASPRTDQLGFVPMLAALLCRWRLGKGVYRIHPRMLTALRDTDLSADIPVAGLYHLPEWAILVETPQFSFLDQPIGGFAAYLNSNFPLRPDPELVLHLFQPGPYRVGDFPAYTRSFLLTEDTLGTCFSASLAKMTASEVEQTGWCALAPFLSVLLYLCSANREIEGMMGQPFQPPAPRIQQTQHGLRAHPADRIQTWQVAWRIGAALETAAPQGQPTSPLGSPTGRTLKPHLRRAHWHLFWVGPQRSKPRIRWLPPIPINVSHPDALPVTIRPVSGSNESSDGWIT